jgi:hypothetical protein
MGEDTKKATFEEFKNSFSYGIRSDMNFKFLKSLSDYEAGDFFQGLLWKLGDASNEGDFEPVLTHIYEWQIRAYEGTTKWKYSDMLFSPPGKPLNRSKVGLMTTSGHYVEGDDPEPFGIKNMDAEEAQARISEFLKTEPVLSAIPMDTPRDKLRLRHGGYDNRAALEDFNIVLPLDLLMDMVEEGKIGQAAENAYSFVGACAQNTLKNKSAPQWSNMLKDEGVEAMILVPV